MASDEPTTPDTPTPVPAPRAAIPTPTPPVARPPAPRPSRLPGLLLAVAALSVLCAVGLVALAIWEVPIGFPRSSAPPAATDVAAVPLPTPTEGLPLAPTATPTPAVTPTPTVAPPTVTPTPSVADLLAEVDAAWGLGDWTTVIRDLQKALVLEPGNPDYQGKLYVALINYGRTLQAAGRLPEAAAAYEAARQIVPDSPEIDPLLTSLTPTPTPTVTPDPKPLVAKYVAEASPLINRVPLVITEWRQQLEYGTLQLRLGDPRGLTTIQMSSRVAGIELSSINARLGAIQAPPQVLGAHNRALTALAYLMEASVQLDRAAADNDVSKVMWADTLLMQATPEADAAVQELKRVQQSYGV